MNQPLQQARPTKAKNTSSRAASSQVDPSAGSAGAIETHISVLFFLGERVYKLRKPVRFDFLDFSSREEREADCYREVELNSRYAPDVYLGVYDVEDTGRPVDHLVVMRRLPENRRLSTLVLEGRARPDDIVAITRTLVMIEPRSERSAVIDAQARPDALLDAWHANAEEIAPFVGSLVEDDTDRRICELAGSYLRGRGPLFEERIRLGRIRDGHGDLRAQDIFCLDDGPRILDCIEFDDRLRFGDVLDDLAFLAMDLEHLGARALVRVLWEKYSELSDDHFPDSLAYHYCATRAYVRAKVSCLSHAEGLSGTSSEARAMHELARSFLERARVLAVLVGGLPGTGKSTLAASLGDVTGATVLRSDEIRKEIAGSGSASSGADLYSESTTKATYETMLGRARRALERGESVILDASWTNEKWRVEARAIAAETSSELTELCCRAPRALAEDRIEKRRRQGTDPSDATAEIALALSTIADPWPTSATVDTSVEVEQSLEIARAAIGR